MGDGYYSVEPMALLKLFGHRKRFDLAVIVMHWVADELNRLLGADGSISVEVIRMEFQGVYPSLGVRGEFDTVEITARIERLVDALLQETPIQRLVTHAVITEIDWRKFTDDLVGL